MRFKSSTRFIFVLFFEFQCKNMYDHRSWFNCRLSNLKLSSIYIHSAAGAAAAAAVLLLFFSFCYIDTVCGFTTEYLDLIDYNYYTKRCCTTYENVFVYTCLLLCSVAAAAAAYCCCSPSCVGLQNLFPWFTASDSSFFFLFIQTRFLSNVSLGSTVAFSASIFLPIIPVHIVHSRYYGHARSKGWR